MNNTVKDQTPHDLTEFLANGGIIKELPVGYSGDTKSFKQTVIPIEKQKSRSKQPTARQKAKELGLKHFEGSPCSVCSSTLRYTSNNGCSLCNKSSSVRNQKKRVARNEK